MEYERIHKAQTGLISPSKLRMKLVASLNQLKKKDGSDCNSSRTSPARLEASESVNSLLAAENSNFGDEAASVEAPQIIIPLPPTTEEPAIWDKIKSQDTSKADSGNSNSAIFIKSGEDDNLDYDSTSSFEFHKGERSLHPSCIRSITRPLSSKWYDAEKWIMNKQSVQSNLAKKSNLQNQANRSLISVVRVVPESGSSENKHSVKRVGFCEPVTQTGSGMGNSAYGLNEASQPSGKKDMMMGFCTEMDFLDKSSMGLLPSIENLTEETSGVPGIRSVSMRDTGTEMTPIPSEEPSRSVTPADATTPTRSPSSSIPSTPRRREPSPSPTGNSAFNESREFAESGNVMLSEQEMKLKTRREIVALGVHLGKMNIAAWARDDENENEVSGKETIGAEELEQLEYVNRAAAWEEAEKSKHDARLKREEIRIHAWETQQKAQLDAEMRKIEAQMEQIKAAAQEKMIKKIALARHKSDKMRAAAEAKRNRQAEITQSQAEYIRETGRIPETSFICCGWS